MSLMAISTPRSSVFTFESTVHSSHVLCCLNEQRCQDSLCDVTVVVEGQSFRAHRSVLASCSEYFAQRISSLAQQGAVITLPQEVTVAGFEPLLKFAYTSKLHFGKTNVLDIQSSASVLGFRDLDEACFDFLLPKFFSSNSSSPPFERKPCCKKKCKRPLSKENCGAEFDSVLLDDKEVKPVAESSSQQEVTWDCNKSVNNKMGIQNSADTVAPVAEGMNDPFIQCPKYRKFQLACGKEMCVPEKSLTSPVTSGIRDDCVHSCLPCFRSENGNIETLAEVPEKSTPNTDGESKGAAKEPRETEIHETKTENCGNTWEVNMANKDTVEREGKWHDEVKESNVIKLKEEMAHTSGISSSEAYSAKTGHLRSSELILHHCPLRALDKVSAITRSLGHEMFDNDGNKMKEARETGELEPVSTHQNTQVETGRKGSDNAFLDVGKGGKTSSMERMAILTDDTRIRRTMAIEVCEQLPGQLGSDKSTSQLNFQNPEAGCSTDTRGIWPQTPSLEWPKLYNNLGSTRSTCRFLQDLDQIKCQWKPTGTSECEGASPSGVSSVNSGEDGDSETETEGDSESSTRERALQVQLPFPVDWIVNLSRNDFQQLLKQHVFTREQLDIVHDMRRRSKNRLAAQRCRKRKLDCIYNLQCEINKLKTEREKLILEKSQLSQLKVKTRHSVTVLCQRVCDEANLQPDQLQVLTKYTSSDCPLSSFSPQSDTFLSQHGLPLQPHASLTVCSGSHDTYETSEEDASSSSRDTLTGQHSL